MSRSSDLLQEAAKCFDDLSSRFNSNWLSEHGVTLDECGDLSENIAHAIRYYLKHREEALDEQLKDAVKAAMGPSFANYVDAEIKYQRSRKALDNKK